MLSTFNSSRAGRINPFYSTINPAQRRNFQEFATRMRARRRQTTTRGRVRMGRSETYTQRKRTRSGSGILGGTNADKRFVYRKKRMPKRKRRTWVRFTKKVHAVAEKELGPRTVLFNDQILQTGVTVGEQNCLTLCLYPQKSGQGFLNDLSAISTLENAGAPTSAAGITTWRSTKMLFQSAVMDLTIRNTSTFQTGADPSSRALDASASIELDVYEFMIRGNEPANAGATCQTFSQCLQVYDDPNIGGAGAGNELDIKYRGTTPFELPRQIGQWKIKILKKTKFFIPNGQTITHQIRDPKRHVANMAELQDGESFYKPGWTKGLYLIYKLVPGLTEGNSISTYQCRLNIGASRKYLYKLEGANEAREWYGGGSYAPVPQS